VSTLVTVKVLSVSVLERAVVLPRDAFFVAWSMIDLPEAEAPAIFGTDRYLSGDDESIRALHGDCLTLLREKSLARGGRLNPLWIKTLTLIASAAHEFYAFCRYRDGSHGAILIAVSGDDAVRVIADRAVVIIEPITAQWPATTLLDSLPSVEPARVREVAVSRAEVENGPIYPDDPLAEPVDTRDLDELTAVMSAPRDASHELYVACRRGKVRSKSSAITALDLSGRGRVLTYATGDDHIVMTSATSREIILTLNNTLNSL
jgi:hypothetical protein